MRVVVAPLADFKPGERRIITVGGRSIGVFRIGDRFYGIRNRCPHHGGPLCLGRVGERVAGDPGVYELTGRRTLRCPWHGWEFDLETGVCLDEATLRAAVYPARIEDGRVLGQA